MAFECCYLPQPLNPAACSLYPPRILTKSLFGLILNNFKHAEKMTYINTKQHNVRGHSAGMLQTEIACRWNDRGQPDVLISPNSLHSNIVCKITQN